MTMNTCFLAEGHLLAGRPAPAADRLQEAHRQAEGRGEGYLLAEIHRLEAAVLLARGAPASEAEGRLRTALDVARRQGARLWELRVACDLARLRRDQGRHAEARDLLVPVYTAFTEGFGFPDLVEARALLEDLGAAQ